jgi:hypothetical protein
MYGGYDSARPDISRAWKCTHALRLSALNSAGWKEYNAELSRLRKKSEAPLNLSALDSWRQTSADRSF